MAFMGIVWHLKGSEKENKTVYCAVQVSFDKDPPGVYKFFDTGDPVKDWNQAIDEVMAAEKDLFILFSSSVNDFLVRPDVDLIFMGEVNGGSLEDYPYTNAYLCKKSQKGCLQN